MAAHARDGKPGYGTLKDGRSKPTYFGVLSVPAPSISERQTLWYCPHNHTLQTEATRCAEVEKRHLLSMIEPDATPPQAGGTES